MAGDTPSDPRRRGGVTAYWVGESQSTSYSDKTWDRVRLTAKKLMALTRVSNEINEDAVINLGDDYAREIVYAFAAKEDQAGFNGDGTSAYGGITGIRQALLGVDATISNILGLASPPARATPAATTPSRWRTLTRSWACCRNSPTATTPPGSSTGRSGAA